MRLTRNEAWTNSPQDIATILDRWRGSKAQAVAYTVSHGVLILRLYPAQPTSPRSAYIQCKDCQTIQLYQTDWERADISISSSPHRLGTVYTITDPGRLHVVCWAAFLTESDTRINFHHEWSNLE
jgi:hypothetical protein